MLLFAEIAEIAGRILLFAEIARAVAYCYPSTTRNVLRVKNRKKINS
jgi:hypothetical protein